MTGDLKTARSAVDLARRHVERIKENSVLAEVFIGTHPEKQERLMSILDLLVVAVDELVARAEQE